MKRPGCPLCNGELAYFSQDGSTEFSFYQCPLCGRFELREPGIADGIDKNHLAAYLFYHCYTSRQYYTTLDPESCERWRVKDVNAPLPLGMPVHIDREMVDNWYPQTLSERVDNILLYFNLHIPHMGETIKLSVASLQSLLFVDRWEMDQKEFSLTQGQYILRRQGDCIKEVEYMLTYLQDTGLIKYKCTDGYQIVITLSGYMRIQELQKNRSHSNDVLVAMKFGEGTQKLREAIRRGITDAGYRATFIDEVQHNEDIATELLKHIRDSKFVVVDLTHQNNGAYFEEGYAMGLGKPVIQLCAKKTKLHFDVAQKNTILWETEADIPKRLCDRIRATMD